MKARPDFRGNQWFALFRAEDQVNQHFGKGLWHGG